MALSGRIRSSITIIVLCAFFTSLHLLFFPWIKPILVSNIPPEYLFAVTHPYSGMIAAGLIVFLFGIMATPSGTITKQDDYKSYFENALEGKFKSTPEGRFLDVNRALVRMLGYRNKPDVLNLDLNKELYMDAHEREQLKTQYQDNGQVKGMVVRWRKRDGSSLYVQLFARRVGQHYEGLAIDITRSKRTEQSLAASQQQFEALVEDSFFGIYIMQDNMVQYANSQFAEIFGYEAEKFGLGTTMSSLISDKSRAKVAEETRRLSEGNASTVRYTVEGTKKDGSTISVQMHGALTEYHGRSAIIGTVMDITPLSQAATELKRSKEEYHAVITSIKEVICQLDPNGNFTFINPAWVEMSGYGVQESIGAPLMGYIHPWRRDEFQVEFKKILSKEVNSIKLETLLLRKDSDQRWMEVNIQNIKNSLGEVIGISGIIEDITLQKNAEKELTASRERYEKLVETMHDGLVIQDKNGKILYVNQRLCELLGYTRDQLMKKPLLNFMEPEGADEVKRHLGRNNIVSGTSLEVDWVRSTNGRISTITSPQRIGEDPANSESFMLVTDITDRKLSELALKESEQRYALAAEGANDGLWDWDLSSNKLYLSARWSQMLGYSVDEFGTAPEDWFSRVHPDDLQNLKIGIKSHLHKDSQRLENEHRMLHKDGKYRWMLVRGVAVRQAEKAMRLAGSLTDITERKEHEQALWREAFYDTLTSLPNRSLFRERLERALTRASRNKDYIYAVMFLDLDRFKWVNDSLGHLIGDKLLIGIARRLEKCLRPGDTVARMGGDEFNILLDDIHDIDEAIQVANRIQQELTMPFDLEGNEVFTSTSIGIAQSTPEYSTVEDILRDADTALYRAKGAGKNCHSVFDHSMHAQAVDRLTLESDLRRALEREQLSVLYQPIIDVVSEQILGFEALLRWNHPDRGLILPSDFVHIAEETGDIVHIGEWALREACAQMSAWGQKYPLPLSMNVNLSSKQFGKNDIIANIASILKEFHLSPSALRLEITESIIMKHGDPAVQTLERIKDLGLHLCIDDFGTGYSSLSYLHRFPIDFLKIDRSFVAQMDSDKEKFEIVKAIISLAHSLGLQVTAEGVETERQLQLLKELKCELAQGFYFARALSSEDATKMLESHEKSLTKSSTA